MGWEVRRGRKYYYRSRRVDGRVVKEYFGSGAAAEEAARIDATAAAEKRRQRERLHEFITELAEINRRLDAQDVIVDAAVEAYMTAGGYHKCRGEWRKKRVKRDAPKPPTGTQNG